MKKKNDDINILLEYKSSWVIRYGVLLFSILIMLIISLTFIVKVPVTEKIQYFVINQKVSPTKAIATIQQKNNIKKNQKVILKLDEFNSYEYGVIEGIINNNSFTQSKDGTYEVEIKLTKELKTTVGYKIPSNLKLQGTGEIFLNDQPLFDIILSHLRVRSSDILEK